MISTEVALLDLVGSDLQRVEAKMLSVGDAAYQPLAEAFRQLLGSGGKRLRPALALAAWGLFAPEVPDSVVAMAAAVETLHTATLVHDDLIDNALMRRGVSTLNATWNKGATVLAGDYVFARAAGFAAETGNVRVVQLFADTLKTIVEGELRQLFTARDWQQAKRSYYDRIFAKTASLFAAATTSPALLAGAAHDEEQALFEYGRDLGIAFQISDDVLDYLGDEATLGKPVGGDLRQGIATLPFFHFLQGSDDPAAVLALLNRPALPGHEDPVGEVVDMIRSSEAGPLALEEARGFARRAAASLDAFPDGPYRRALRSAAEFAVTRRA
jgi:geranylgeranyl pyrophosphate synthase